MRRIVLSLSVVLGCLAAPGLSMADDQAIAEQIVSLLDRQKEVGNLRGFNLGMKVNEGIVWFEGDVANQQQETIVLDIARRVPGVVRVVNAIEVRSTGIEEVARYPASSRGEQGDEVANQTIFGGMASAVSRVLTRNPETRVQPVVARTEEAPAGSGSAYRNVIPRQVAPVQVVQPAPVQVAQPGPVPVTTARPLRVAQVPAIPTQAAGQGGMPVPIGSGAVPAYVPGTGQGVRPATYDHPSMPGYAWPSYAAHPNYAAVTYPQQYSPAAWPYIGPFYPYPQVPLGWRKVTLEWDDGWWFLDFNDR